jgi:hypothetical protein
MAVVVITNSVIAGAMGGLLEGRFNGSVTPAAFAAAANAAAAVGAEFATVNAGSGAAIADADNAEVGTLVAQVAYGTMAAQGANSATATDYVASAQQIYAASKEAIAKLS